MPLVALEIKNGVTSGPDYTQATYPKRSVSLPYFLAYPGQQEDCFTYGEGGQCVTDLPYSTPWSLIPYMYPSYPESPYLTFWFRNASYKNGWTSSFLPGSNGEQLVYHYIFGDPKQRKPALSAEPTQHVYKNTDYAQCATFGFSCSPNTCLWIRDFTYRMDLAARPTLSCCTNLTIFMPVITHRGM